MTWMATTYPSVYDADDANHYWSHHHISALAWQAGRAALQSACQPVSDEINFGAVKLLIKDPVSAKAFLQKAGILNASGKLAEAFGGDADALATLQSARQPNERSCPHCNYTGSMHCGDVVEKYKADCDPKDCSHYKVYGRREVSGQNAAQPAQPAQGGEVAK